MQQTGLKPSTKRYRPYKPHVRQPDKWTLEADGPFGEPIRALRFLGAEEGQNVGVTTMLFVDWVLWAQKLKRLEPMYKKTKVLRGFWSGSDRDTQRFVLKGIPWLLPSLEPRSLQAFADAHAEFKKLCRRHRQERARCPYPLMFPRRYLLLVTIAKRLEAHKCPVL